jgi:hypothetical protein
MKAALFATLICLFSLPAFAKIQPAPAPLIGAGIPGLVVVGGVLLGRKLLKRKSDR